MWSSACRSGAHLECEEDLPALEGGPEVPCSCPCHEVGGDFDADELGIDPDDDYPINRGYDAGHFDPSR